MANEQMQQDEPDTEQESGGGQEPGEGGAADAISDIQEGFQSLGKLMKAAGSQVSPQDLKLFQQALQATDAFIQSISGPAEGQGQGAPQRPAPGGPMAAHANAGARPAGY